MKDKTRKLDLKNLIKIFATLWFLSLIVLMTLTNLGLNNQFVLIDWLGNALILLGIMVFGLLMGESVGTDKQMNKIGGLYQKSLKEFNTFLDSIDDILMYFIQFFQWFMPQELYDKKVNYLVMNNIEITKAKLIVSYCSFSDIEDLAKHAIEKEDENGKKVFIRQIDVNQIEPIKEVLSGEIKLDISSPNYYLNALGKSNTKSVLEVGKQLDKEIKFNKNSNRAVKIIVSLFISLIFALFTVKDFTKGETTQAWVNLVVRITALLTSLLSGWLSSVVDVRLKAEKIDNKLKVLKLFKNSLDKKIFIPCTEEELAKKEYEKYMKEEEERSKRVIIPEIVSDMDRQMLENNE